MSILNPADLRNFVLHLIDVKEEHYNGSLEEYLRSLWQAILLNRKEKVSFALFAHLFQESFSLPPAPFQQSWALYNKPASLARDTLSGEEDEENFAFLEATILFQIADLHSLPSTLLDDPAAYFGLISPGGHQWYNLNPFLYLEGGTALLEFSSNLNCDWGDLADILEEGRIFQ